MPCTKILVRFPVDADPVQRCFASCVEAPFRKSQMLLQVSLSLFWVQLWFEPDGSLLDGVLLYVGQTEKAVSIPSVLNCEKACVIGFVGNCVSS